MDDSFDAAYPVLRGIDRADRDTSKVAPKTQALAPSASGAHDRHLLRGVGVPKHAIATRWTARLCESRLVVEPTHVLVRELPRSAAHGVRRAAGHQRRSGGARSGVPDP